jgi:hypothetical protein
MYGLFEMGKGSVDFWTKWWEGLLLEVLVDRAVLVVSRLVSSTEDTADVTCSFLKKGRHGYDIEKYYTFPT